MLAAKSAETNTWARSATSKGDARRASPTRGGCEQRRYRRGGRQNGPPVAIAFDLNQSPAPFLRQPHGKEEEVVRAGFAILLWAWVGVFVLLAAIAAGGASGSALDKRTAEPLAQTIPSVAILHASHVFAAVARGVERCGLDGDQCGGDFCCGGHGPCCSGGFIARRRARGGTGPRPLPEERVTRPNSGTRRSTVKVRRPSAGAPLSTS